MSREAHRGRPSAFRRKQSPLGRGRRTPRRGIALTAVAALTASGVTSLSAHAVGHTAMNQAGVGQEFGVNLLKDIHPGGHHGDPRDLYDADGRLYFTATDGTHGHELWTSDGTTVGTRMVADLTRGPGSSAIVPMGHLGELFLFSHDHQLWRTDGTTTGTSLVAEVAQRRGFSSYDGLGPGTATANGFLYFSADDGEHGYELWRTDGTTAGTTMVADLNPSRGADGSWPEGSYPTDLTAVGDTVFFAADDGEHGRELWRSDGTATDTVMVRDVQGEQTEEYAGQTHTHNRGSSPEELTVAGGTLYFTADDGDHGRELWRSDGTTTGTTIVRDVRPAPQPGTYGHHSSYPTRLTALGDTLYFTADDGEHGRELWRSDGTTTGTTMVVDIRHPLPYDGYDAERGSHPTSLTAVGDTLFLVARDDERPRLWRSDGTAAGTTRVVEPPNARGLTRWQARPDHLTAVGDTLHLTGSVLVGTNELWRVTTTGTESEVSRLTGASHLDPSYLTESGGVLFFVAEHGTRGRELWRVGGTPHAEPMPAGAPTARTTPQPAATAVNQAARAKARTRTRTTARFKPRKRVATIRVKVTRPNRSAGQAKGPVKGKVRIQVKRNKKNIRTITRKLNSRGVVTVKVKKKFLRKKGLYRVTAQYQGNAKHKKSKNPARFKVRKKG